MAWIIGKSMHPGNKRRGKNQDLVGVDLPNWFNKRPPLLVLADGMGGYAGGETASKIVVQTFLKHYRRYRGGSSYDAFLSQAVEEAHRQIG